MARSVSPFKNKKQCRRVEQELRPATWSSSSSSDRQARRRRDEMTAGGGDGAATVKMVDMPVEYLFWVLAQDKEDYRVPTLDDYTAEDIDELGGVEAVLGVIGSLQAAYDEIAEFRAWVLDAALDGGRVMIREDMLFSDPDEWQEMVDRAWVGARQELVDGEKTTGPLGKHTYVLSTYLSMLYQYAAPVPTFWGT